MSDAQGMHGGLRPVRATGTSDLVAASKEYEFFLPYIPMVLLPNVSVDPLDYSRQTTGLPSSVVYWPLGFELVQLGKLGAAHRIGGTNLFGIPKEEWPHAQEAILSFFLKGSKVLHYIIQDVEFQNPFETLNVSPIKARAVGVECDEGAWVLSPLTVVPGGLTLSYSIIFDKTLAREIVIPE